MRRSLLTLALGALGALLLPGALVLVACLLWVHAQRYRHLHGRAFIALRQAFSRGDQDVWTSVA